MNQRQFRAGSPLRQVLREDPGASPQLRVRTSLVWLGISAVLALLFLVLAFFISGHPLLDLDLMVTHDFQGAESPFLTQLMQGVSWIGNFDPVYVGLVVIAAAGYWLMNYRLEALFVFGTAAESMVLNRLIKVVLHRPRPTPALVDVLSPETGFSFPSGHVMGYLGFFGMVLILSLVTIKYPRWLQIVMITISAFFVLFVGPSRIYLGDHWLTDVLGSTLITLRLPRPLQNRREQPPKLRSNPLRNKHLNVLQDATQPARGALLVHQKQNKWSREMNSLLCLPGSMAVCLRPIALQALWV